MAECDRGGCGRNTCHPCRAKYMRRYHKERREKLQRDGINVDRVQLLRRTYGMTDQQFAELLAKQDGRCAICGRDKATNEVLAPGRKPKSMSVDHCHATGKVRGLLCAACNRAIGLFKDDPTLCEAAAAYLRRPFPTFEACGPTTVFDANGRALNSSGRPRFVTHQGETLNIQAWARKLGLPAPTLYARLANGWSVEDALMRPKRARVALCSS